MNAGDDPDTGEPASGLSHDAATTDGASGLDDLLHALARPVIDRGLHLRPGARLGRYEILRRLGAGGMGVVYQALDTLLGREVALKVIARSGARLAFVSPLQREARGAAALRHPGVVTVYDAAEIDGVATVAMELVRGQTLRALLKGRDLPLPRARRLFEQVVDAVAHAHACGVVHRDLKRENIMVDEAGDARVVDFGLARLVDALASAEEAALLREEPSLPRSGSRFAGTPGYRAPEQERGALPDARADVYALGIVLSELLDASPRRLGEGGTRAALDAIAHRCRKLAPGDRFVDGAALRSALAARRGRERWLVFAAVASSVMALGGAAASGVLARHSWSQKPFRVVSHGRVGCATDGGTTLRLSAPEVRADGVRFALTREDEQPWSDTGPLVLFLGPGPECGRRPANLVKRRVDPIAGARAQSLELGVIASGTPWEIGEEKKFWVGVEAPDGSVLRASHTLVLRRQK